MAQNDYWIPDAKEIRRRYLRDLEIGLMDAGVQEPATEEGTEYYIIGTAIGNMAAVIYAQLRNVLTNTNELTATGQALDDIRQAIGLPVVPAQGGSGKVLPSISVSGPIFFPDGLGFTLDRNGLRGLVLGSQTITAGGEIHVQMLDTGEDSNASPSEKITFSSPPNNVSTQASVGLDGITGGVPEETDERKRQRISNRRQNLPSGGNWAHAIELAENSTGSVQKAFCYPAIIGPSSMKVVVTKSLELNRKNPLNFSRVLGESSLEIVSNAVLGEFPESIEAVIQSAEDESFDCSIGLTLPEPQNGGWYNSNPFPSLVIADAGRVTVSTVTSTNEIIISGNTTVSPTIGTRIAWFSPEKRMFLEAEVTAFSGSAGAWALVLDRPLVIGEAQVSVGDYISPGAASIVTYGEEFLAQTNLLGPGENTSAGARLPRALRRPFHSNGWGSSLNATQLKALSTNHPEILDFAWLYRSLSTPTVPSAPEDAPNVLVLRHLGIYPIES